MPNHILLKLHCIDAEVAGHVHKLDVKLQSLCGSGFSLFAVRILAKPCAIYLSKNPGNEESVNYWRLNT